MKHPLLSPLLITTFGAVVLAGSMAMAEAPLHLDSPNGFNLTFSLIPREEIFSGGPPKDGIPALTSPRHVSADRAQYLSDEDLVVGVVLGNEARAYPLRILVWHENANDVVGGRPIAVTYCPLCNSAFVFDRRIGDSVRDFGISGLLWNSNVLLYDRQEDGERESLWSQVRMAAVTGPAAKAGLRMKFLPSELTTWAEWRSKHPETSVLSNRTGFSRNYGLQLYHSYFRTDRLMFPARLRVPRPKGFMFKEPMVLVQAGERLKAYAVRDVAAAEGGSVVDLIGQQRLRLTYLTKAGTVRVEALDGSPEGGIPVAYTFWFALSAMMPNVEVYEPP